MTKTLANRPVDKLKAIVNQPTVQEQFKNALGKNSDMFVASLIDVFNDGLQNCEPGGVIQEALKAAVLKLPISKNLGFAYLVPYGGKATFQIGYKGMIQLAMRSGQVKNINAGVVYDGEWQGTDKLRGTYDLTGKKKNDVVVGYFSYMELINGFEKTVYWTKDQIIAHAKAKSASYGNKKSAWTTDFDAMAIKTTLRALFGKYAPMSIDFVMAIQSDEDEKPEPKNINLDVDELSPPPNPKEKGQGEVHDDDKQPPDNFENEPDFGE